MPFYREFNTNSFCTIRQWSGRKDSKYFIRINGNDNLIFSDVTTEETKTDIGYQVVTTVSCLSFEEYLKISMIELLNSDRYIVGSRVLPHPAHIHVADTLSIKFTFSMN